MKDVERFLPSAKKFPHPMFRTTEEFHREDDCGNMNSNPGATNLRAATKEGIEEMKNKFGMRKSEGRLGI
jgi:hypothetical protein